MLKIQRLILKIQLLHLKKQLLHLKKQPLRLKSLRPLLKLSNCQLQAPSKVYAANPEATSLKFKAP